MSANKSADENHAARQGGDHSERASQILKTALHPCWIKYAVLCVAAMFVLLIGVLIGHSAGDSPLAKQPDLPSLSKCVADTLPLLGQQHTLTADNLHEARDHCYSMIQGQGLLNDFAIRKLNFFQQYRANGVLMWMVITVTFSGVLLAALQLLASYQLATMNKGSFPARDAQLIVKHDQLVLKSSVTGLFILLISFCFFLIFVFYVYRFENLSENNSSVLPPVGVLPPGGLGPPSSAQPKP